MNSASPSRKQAFYEARDPFPFDDEVSAAALNALPDHIAVLDAEGTIVAVNSAWSNFAQKHGVLEQARVGAGINYFQVCRTAISEHDQQAQIAAEGIQAVLSGKRASFRQEYRCTSVQGDLWFEMSVRPLHPRQRGAVVIHSDITQHKHTERVLEENENRLRLLTDHTPVLLWATDEHGKCVDFNRQWLAFTGRSLEQELGGGWLEGVHAGDRESCLNTYMTAFAERKPLEMEYRLRRADGQYRRMLEKAVPFFSSQGTFMGFLGSAVDVTEQEPSQRAIQQESTSLELVADLLPAIDRARSPAQALQACVDHICRKLNWPLGHVFRRSTDSRRCLRSAQIWHTKERARYAALVSMTEESVLPPGSELAGAVVLSRKPLWVRLSAVPPEFPRGQVALLLGIESALAVPVLNGDEVAFVMEFGLESSNRPSRKLLVLLSALASQVGRLLEGQKAHQELELSEKRYRAFFEKAIVGACQTDVEGAFTKVNDAFCRITGYPRRELLGKNFTEMIHPDNNTDKHFRRLLSGEIESYKDKKRIIRKDGTLIWIEVDAAVVRNTAGTPIHSVAVVQDITQRKLAQEGLLRAHSDLKVLASRLIAAQEEERARIGRELHDSTSQLMAALSLDVSNIRASLPEGLVQTMRGLARLKQRIFQLAANVRELSHELHPAVLEHAGLAAALQSFCTEFRHREKIRVTLKMGPIPRLNRQAALSLYRIVQEGVQNIRKHARVKEAEVELSCGKDQLVLSIRDKGAGFDPSASRAGLGLISIQERVRLMGGQLKVISSSGDGTKLVIHAPARRILERKQRSSPRR